MLSKKNKNRNGNNHVNRSHKDSYYYGVWANGSNFIIKWLVYANCSVSSIDRATRSKPFV